MEIYIISSSNVIHFPQQCVQSCMYQKIKTWNIQNQKTEFNIVMHIEDVTIQMLAQIWVIAGRFMQTGNNPY